MQLHVFADASKKVYGAVAFFTSGNLTTLVMAKNRVTPLRTLTLPKLELMSPQKSHDLSLMPYKCNTFLSTVAETVKLSCTGQGSPTIHEMLCPRDQGKNSRSNLELLPHSR